MCLGWGLPHDHKAPDGLWNDQAQAEYAWIQDQRWSLIRFSVGLWELLRLQQGWYWSLPVSGQLVSVTP